MDHPHPTTVHHPNVILTWGDVFTAPINWDDNDIPQIDPTYLKERGFNA